MPWLTCVLIWAQSVNQLSYFRPYTDSNLSPACTTIVKTSMDMYTLYLITLLTDWWLILTDNFFSLLWYLIVFFSAVTFQICLFMFFWKQLTHDWNVFKKDNPTHTQKPHNSRAIRFTAKTYSSFLQESMHAWDSRKTSRVWSSIYVETHKIKNLLWKVI